MNTTEKIALEFSRVLRANLTADEMRKVIKRNEADTDMDVCHSHDFCDANYYMDIAFENVTGNGVDMSKDGDLTMVNNAWNIAKQSKFSVA